MLFYVVGSQAHGLISPSFVLEHAEGSALAVTCIKPIVTHKSLRLLNDWHELLAYQAVDLCTVFWIKVIMTNYCKHDASPSFSVPISTSLLGRRSVCRLSRQVESATRVPKMQSIYGTKKNFPVYGSLTTDPDAKSVTSIYFPSSGK